MMIVCAIGLRRGPQLLQRLTPLLKNGEDLLLVHAIDTTPRQRWEQMPSPLRPGPHSRPERDQQMNEAEKRLGESILAEARTEAQRLGWTAVVRLERGNPEQLLLQIAQEIEATLLVAFARELAEGHPIIGPRSVGHTARFVLDHSPCPVLLLR
jgi:nucleotide-binding universal stress UspA family protein